MNNIILFKNFTKEEKVEFVRTWVSNALKAMQPKQDRTKEDNSALADYFGSHKVLTWESNVTALSTTIACFVATTKLFNGRVIVDEGRPKIVFTSIANPKEFILTSAIVDVEVMSNGYARITTDDNTVYHLWSVNFTGQF